MTAQFMESNDPYSALNLVLPLGCFPHLAVGTLWKDGVFVGTDSSDSRVFSVSVPGREAPTWEVRSLSDLTSEQSYPLFDLPGAGTCFVVPTQSGEELIIPTAEVLRAWYFFDSQVIPAVIAGAIINPKVMSAAHLPWIPELSYRPAAGAPRIVHKNRLSVSSTKNLARLLFENEARRRANSISQAIRGHVNDPSIHLPAIPPPFCGAVNLTVRGREIACTDGKPKRFLVHQLLASDEQLSYSELERVPLNDLRPGSEISDDIRKSVRRYTRNIFDDDAMELTGDGPDESTKGEFVAGLGFNGSAIRVPTLVPAKGEQTDKVVWIKDGDATVRGGSVDPTAEPKPGTPPVSQDDETDQSKREAVDLDIAASFQFIVDAIKDHPELRNLGWEGRFPMETRKIYVQHESGKYWRGFFVAEFSDDTRRIYLLDAEQKTSSEKFRLMLFETVSGEELARQDFVNWLSSFPSRPGCPWTNPRSGPLGFAFKRLNHQPPSSTEEETRSKFRARIIREIVDLIRG